MGAYLASHVGAADMRAPFSRIGMLPFLRRDERAACASADPEAWFLEQGQRYAQEVFDTCADCPIRVECLDWALANDETEGVWGGTTPDDRRALLGRTPKGSRRQRAVRCDVCGYTRQHYALGLCEHCYRQRQAHTRPVGVCAECKRRTKIPYKGHCDACYMRAYRAKGAA